MNMITVQLNRQNFEYDVHSLVKAFYPEQEVHISCVGSAKEMQTDRDIQGKGSDQEPLRLVICFLPEACEADCKSADTGEEQRISKDDISGISVRFETAQGVMLFDEVSVEPGTQRKEIKNILKKLLYQLLVRYTGAELPWGNLTGIRPTKIPMSLLEQGWKNSQIAQYMRDTYYTSREKTALAIMIANRERHIMQDINFKNGYSLYVGIPFCPSICLYCSFSSSPLHLWRDQVDTYLDALCKEIDYASEAFAGKELNTVYIGGGTPTTLEPYQMDRLLTKLEQRFCFDKLREFTVEAGRPKELNTVYIGGGTPTTLEPYQMDRLLTKLEQRFCFDKLREFTVEAGRPDSITKEKLEVLRAHGISRISINPQTMNQKTLDLIGRRHTVEQTEEAFYLARELGFDNINMDLIVGLPGEERAEVERTQTYRRADRRGILSGKRAGV